MRSTLSPFRRIRRTFAIGAIIYASSWAALGAWALYSWVAR